MPFLLQLWRGIKTVVHWRALQVLTFWAEVRCWRLTVLRCQMLDSTNVWPSMRLAALSSHTVCRCMVSVKQPFSQMFGYVKLFPNIFISWFWSSNVLCLFPLVPPSISSKGGMITVVVNEPVRLECEASGVPMPSLTWLKEGRPVSSFSDGVQVCAFGSLDALVCIYTCWFALYLQVMKMLYQFSISF